MAPILRGKHLMFLASAMVVMPLASATAATYYSNGSGGWSGGTPVAGDLAVIQSGHANSIGNVAYDVRVDAGGTYNVYGYNVKCNNLILNGGTLNAGGNRYASGPVQVLANSYVTSIYDSVNFSTVTGSGNLMLKDTANTTAWYLNLTDLSGYSGTLAVDNTGNLTGSVNFGWPASHPGNLEVRNNSKAGTTNTGTIGYSGSITGNGEYWIQQSISDLNSGFKLSAGSRGTREVGTLKISGGNSYHNLNFKSGSIIEIDVNDAGVDLLNIPTQNNTSGHMMAFSSGSSLDFYLDMTGATPTHFSKTFATWYDTAGVAKDPTGTGNLTVHYYNVDGTPYDTSKFTNLAVNWDMTNNIATISGDYTAIPEPTTAGVVLLSAVGLLSRRRMRRNGMAR